MAVSKDEVVGLYGPWTAYNIEYTPGEFTISPVVTLTGCGIAPPSTLLALSIL